MQTEHFIYFTSCIVIIYYAKLNQQKYYLEHTNEIISIAQGDHMIATSELAKKPEIHVWNPKTLSIICLIKGQHRNGVHFLNFMNRDTLLASCGVRIDSPIFIHNARTGQFLISTCVKDQIVSFTKISSFVGKVTQVLS